MCAVGSMMARGDKSIRMDTTAAWSAEDRAEAARNFRELIAILREWDEEERTYIASEHPLAGGSQSVDSA